MALIIDSSTGTVLTAHSCYFLSDDTFTEEEWEQIDDFSDSEISRIGKDNGVNVEKSEDLLHSISEALWGEDSDKEWNADTLNAIADAMRLIRPDLCP
jgi:hypothetical protein